MHYIWQFYLIIGIILLQAFCLLFNYKNKQMLFLCLCGLELIFISGFRDWHIGNDTFQYVQTFYRISNNLWIESSYMEQGYIWYNKFLALFSSNPQTILLANAIIIIVSISSFIKKYSSIALLSVLLFIILNFGGTLNIMRQYLAIAFILCGVPFVIKRQIFLFALSCILASTFHYSALLAIGIYFLYPLSFKTKYLFWILIITLFSFIYLAPILDNVFTIVGRYESYKGRILLGEETKIASIMKFTIHFVIFVFCYFTYRYIYNPKIHVFLLRPQFLIFCSIISTCLQFISIRGTILERLVLYYSIFNLISIPFFVYCYSKKIRILVAIGLLICFVFYNSIILVYRPNWNEILPFKFCF